LYFRSSVPAKEKTSLAKKSAAFCLRDANGDLIYAEARRLGVTNSLCAEATTIQEGVRFCIEQQRIPVLIESD